MTAYSGMMRLRINSSGVAHPVFIVASSIHHLSLENCTPKTHSAFASASIVPSKFSLRSPEKKKKKFKTLRVPSSLPTGIHCPGTLSVKILKTNFVALVKHICEACSASLFLIFFVFFFNVLHFML